VSSLKLQCIREGTVWGGCLEAKGKTESFVVTETWQWFKPIALQEHFRNVIDTCKFNQESDVLFYRLSLPSSDCQHRVRNKICCKSYS
jgi:hypothetical protein